MPSSKSKRSPAHLELAKFLPYQLSTLSNRVSSTIANAYQDKFSLSVTEWRIMAVLGEEEGLSADTVSQRTQVEKSLISRALKRLIARNLVRRDTDLADARKHCLRLSHTGIEIYEQIVPVSKQYEKTLFGCLSAAERTQFDKLINKVQAHIQNIE